MEINTEFLRVIFGGFEWKIPTELY